MFDSRSDSFSGLSIICGAHDDHAGDLAHESKVLQTLVGGSVLTYGDAGVRRADLYVQVRVADRIADLLIGAACREHCKRTGKRHHAGCRKACRNAHHISFRDTAVEMSVRISLSKNARLGRACQIRIQNYKVRHLRAQFQKGLSV